jgi:hypothetical protein
VLRKVPGSRADKIRKKRSFTMCIVRVIKSGKMR